MRDISKINNINVILDCIKNRYYSNTDNVDYSLCKMVTTLEGFKEFIYAKGLTLEDFEEEE